MHCIILLKKLILNILYLQLLYDLQFHFLLILDNAIKYSENDTEVIIYIKNNKICIKDQGEGIKKEDIVHIFERFYRAEKSHTTKGYGLGLPLAKHLCDNMKLNLEAIKNEDRGMTFRIG